MTYELPDAKTLRHIPDEYRKCGECDKTKIDELRRSTICCHILCQACLSVKHEKFTCPKCGIELSKSEFVSYKRDDSLMKKEKREKLPKNIKELDRGDFNDTPTYNNFLEEVEILNEKMKTESDPTKMELYIKLAGIKPRKHKGTDKKRRFEAQSKKEQKKPLHELAINVQTNGGMIDLHNETPKNVISKSKQTTVADEIKKFFGYDPKCVQLKKKYEALNWF
ncbi:hypothetical protein ENUP19_0371G0014 [Entamoeba nuttalli]|uniref:RING-type domain-containing protein n=2 Tax=Entamoeba nuttalli TaxID=412467 RepID=K2GCA3_ENTNP|nr:hypothetical protein ENU1_100800 [Entamoeba nuttalli P19]EKE40141.1 hypothetical protein ENU1_100800 [Entamoeba nuttalli P19]|eukprot:XP_008857521.1 hypothetical protein ENU1_100800 [Entamoeba nuttalli P19]